MAPDRDAVTPDPRRMTRIDDQGRPEPPLTADETSTRPGFLEHLAYLAD